MTMHPLLHYGQDRDGLLRSCLSFHRAPDFASQGSDQRPGLELPWLKSSSSFWGPQSALRLEDGLGANETSVAYLSYHHSFASRA